MFLLLTLVSLAGPLTLETGHAGAPELTMLICELYCIPRQHRDEDLVDKMSGGWRELATLTVGLLGLKRTKEKGKRGREGEREEGKKEGGTRRDG